MSFEKPCYSKKAVNRAGAILASADIDFEKFTWALDVLANWRASHSYPINTFQATLRKKLKGIDRTGIVAERLKRTLSIIAKLERYQSMELARMQDIGGLRAIVRGVAQVRMLEILYREAKFEHELTNSKDYISSPKPDGYRGVHLIYRYKNKRAPDYDGLHVELQLRTKLQHAWATAVETMGTFLRQALKSGLGDEEWRVFFELTSAGFAKIEKCPAVPDYETLSMPEICIQVAESERKLRVLEKLRGFSVAANRITEGKGQGSYHLVMLNYDDKSVTITPYSVSRLAQANKDYAEVELRARNGEPVEAVLVSAGPIKALKKAYPNYFLDTHDFIKQVRKMLAIAQDYPLFKSAF
ncbi:MAG: RelA/SpoT domain-containing protein [Desulfovibrio sp.]|jgi:ppGpp synthetase/RelA/SpoT-type nucleotidyltranferase|nr:RelA/SpoT domain-containing protein [Desulfovibrio sp.]